MLHDYVSSLDDLDCLGCSSQVGVILKCTGTFDMCNCHDLSVYVCGWNFGILE